MVMMWRLFVLVENIFRIIFEVLDIEWLQDMWECSDEGARRIMIDFIYLIYMFKTRYRYSDFFRLYPY